MEKEVKFEKITVEDRAKVEKILVNEVVDSYRKEKLEDEFYKYEVRLQNLRFVTAMTNKELKESARLTINLLEALKCMNNNGFDKAAFEKMYAEVTGDGKTSEVMAPIKMWNRMSTDELSGIIYEIDVVRRVGGAWAMLIANPGFVSAILAVYEQLVDKFDDDEFYETCAFFLFRAVMRMHSDEIHDSEEER